MNKFLPKNRVLLYSLFLFLLIGLIIYFFSFKMGAFVNNKDQVLNKTVSEANLNQNTSAPFFIPPTSQTKEVQVYGRIVKLSESEVESNGATHKITENGKTLILAKTEDDKLKQQEGNSVTLVGDIPTDQIVGPQTVLTVKYIQFK